MNTIFCKKGTYDFKKSDGAWGETVYIQKIAFKIPWRKDDDILKNQFQVQEIADSMEKVYIYEHCFGGAKYSGLVCDEEEYIKEYSHNHLIELKKELEGYITTFDCSIDKEPNFVVFDRRPWRTEVYNCFNTGINYLLMSRRLGAKNFMELPDLTKIDCEESE